VCVCVCVCVRVKLIRYQEAKNTRKLWTFEFVMPRGIMQECVTYMDIWVTRKLKCNSEHDVGFEVLTAVVMKSIAIWDITPCSNSSHPKFRKNLLPPSSGSKNKMSKKQVWKPATWFYAGFLSGLIFDRKDEGDMFLRNVGWLPTVYAALYPRR
jgi:hypothetical protein